MWSTIRELDGSNKFLIEENARLRTAEDENKLLREHLNFLKSNDYKYVMSNVVSRNNFV